MTNEDLKRDLHLDKIRDRILETNREEIDDLILRASPHIREKFLEKMMQKMKHDYILNKSLKELVNDLWENIEYVTKDSEVYYKELRNDLIDEIFDEGGFKEYEEAV